MTNRKIDILLVEDNPSDAEMAIRALQKNDLADNLLHLKDGSEALDFLFSEGAYSGRLMEMPRVILLDLKMPKVDGKEVLQRVKSDVRTSTIPIVMLTSSEESRDIRECYRLGANGYVVKPLEFDDYHKALSSLGLFWMLVNIPSL